MDMTKVKFFFFFFVWSIVVYEKLKSRNGQYELIWMDACEASWNSNHFQKKKNLNSERF